MIDHSFIYKERAKVIKEEVEKLEVELKKIQEEFEHHVDFETETPYKLNVLSSRMQEVSSKIAAKDRQLTRLLLEIAN